MAEEGFQPPTPGPEHELMKPFEGTFKSEVKMWMGPGAPMTSSGTMVNRWSLNGLYLEQVYESEPGGPFPGFAGRGFWGFNQTEKVFEGFWIDTASSAMQMEKGSVDQSGKVFEMHSEFSHGGAVMKKRTVFEVINDDQHKMLAHTTPPSGEEMLTMEIVYTRA